MTAATIKRARALRQSSTDAERKLWQLLRTRALGGAKFRRQHPIDSRCRVFCPHRLFTAVLAVHESQHPRVIRQSQVLFSKPFLAFALQTRYERKYTGIHNCNAFDPSNGNMKLGEYSWERVQSWGFRFFVGWFILLSFNKWYNCVWPRSRSNGVISHGAWILSNEERGHILSASTCLEEQCIIHADVEISCLNVNGLDEKFLVFATLPEQYSRWFDDVRQGTAELILNGKAQETSLGLIKTTVIPDQSLTMVGLSSTTSLFAAAMSSRRNQRDFLTVEGSWPIRLQIPLDGLSDGLADLAKRCGEHWKLP